MRPLALFLIVMLLVVGCQSQEDIDKTREALVYKEAQKKRLEEIKRVEIERLEMERLAKEIAKKEANQSTLMKAGITMDDGKLIIDTNKTKEFFSKLANRFTIIYQKIDQELKEENLTSTKDMGFEMSSDTLSVDFNKTDSFFKGWSQKIEKFSKEINLFRDTINDNNLSD